MGDSPDPQSSRSSRNRSRGLGSPGPRSRSPPCVRSGPRISRSPDPGPSGSARRRSPAPLRRGTRNTRSLYLLGHPLHMFAPNRLPTSGEVCRRIYWLVSKDTTSGGITQISCCQDKASSMRCALETVTCTEKNKGEFTGVCILRELLLLWDKGGYGPELRLQEKAIK